MRARKRTLLALSREFNKEVEEPITYTRCDCGGRLVTDDEQKHGYCGDCLVTWMHDAADSMDSCTDYYGERCGLCARPLIGLESECGGFCSASHASYYHSILVSQRMATPVKRVHSLFHGGT